MYLDIDILLLLIKAAACTIASGRYISIARSLLITVLLLSNTCFINYRASSCLALALLILSSSKTLLSVRSPATFLL
jgi:hypothetical protein